MRKLKSCCIFQSKPCLEGRCSACVMREESYGGVTCTKMYQSYERVPCLFLVLIIREYHTNYPHLLLCFFSREKKVIRMNSARRVANESLHPVVLGNHNP